jgi:hypothetical protein
MKAQTVVPGLEVQFRQIGASLYAKIIHKATGLSAGNLDIRPLPVGKIAFCKSVDEIYGGIVDWTKKEFTPEELSKGSKARDIIWDKYVNIG